jgi:peptide/nickel transport system permease protein
MDKETATMSTETTNNIALMEIPPRVNEFRRFIKVFFGRPVVIIGTVIIIIFLITAAIPFWLAPYEPDKTNLDNVLQPPSSEHLLGTDSVGRDTLSRLIYGARVAIMVGVVALLIAAVTGMVLGVIAGYFGGWVYAVIMRFIDAIMAFPMILLMMVIAAMAGAGMKNVMIAVGIGMMPGYARVMCAQVLSAKENDYVLAGRAMGSSNLRLMFRHIFPNCLSVMIVMMTMQIGVTILAEAGLSFLGIGIPLPTATWGSMVSNGYLYLISNPILSLAPGLAIVLVVFGFNMVGDGLRDAIDPRLRGTL